MQIKLIRYKTILNICVVMDLFYFYDCYFRKKNPGPFDFSRQEVLQIGEQWWTLKSNWNLDTGYSKSFTNTPRNIRSTGFWNSVEFILAHHDSFYGCSSKHGFTVERVIVVFWLLILYYRNLLADKIVLKNITLTLYSKRHNARHNCIMHSENSYNREIYIFEVCQQLPRIVRACKSFTNRYYYIMYDRYTLFSRFIFTIRQTSRIIRIRR